MMENFISIYWNAHKVEDWNDLLQFFHSSMWRLTCHLLLPRERERSEGRMMRRAEYKWAILIFFDNLFSLIDRLCQARLCSTYHTLSMLNLPSYEKAFSLRESSRFVLWDPFHASFNKRYSRRSQQKFSRSKSREEYLNLTVSTTSC